MVDGEGSMRCALVGDNLAALAIKNGWEGIIINGCVRDSAVMADMDIGIRALDTHPKKSVKLNRGEVGVVVEVCMGYIYIDPYITIFNQTLYQITLYALRSVIR